MAGGKERWEHDKLVARAILYDRGARRKLIGRMLWADLAVMAAGLWLIDDWLAKHVVGFVLWWCGCGLLTLLVMLFAVYVALAVVREEREKFRK
ncbi:MAG: hypothetical protein ACQCXQ_03940 [Verrucomicrobiales bacterium]